MREEKNKEHFKPSSWKGLPYNHFGDYLKDKYHTRILKVPINAGLICPNRDGTISDRGCIFCSEDGSASSTADNSLSIEEQMDRAVSGFSRKDDETRYIAYFQAFTNTYAPVNSLRKLYDRALSTEKIIGLMIGTRPDCLPDDVIELISSYSKPGFELWVELGMQSSCDKSLRYLNRGHSHPDTADSVVRLAAKGIPVCAHIILGIPGESWNDMMETAEEVSRLPISGVKIHQLHIISGTPLAEMNAIDPVKLMSMREYVSTICDFIERLRPDILIHRLTGDRDAASLIGPDWGLNKGTIQQAILEEFSKRQTFQGFLRQDKY